MVCGNRDFKSRYVHSCGCFRVHFLALPPNCWFAWTLISLNTSQLHVCIIVKDTWIIYIYVCVCVCATRTNCLLNMSASKAKGMIYYNTVKYIIEDPPNSKPWIFPVSSCCWLYAKYLSQVLSSREWRRSWSSADRWCFNYIWVINNFIANYDANYIRGLTVPYVLLN